MKQKFSEGYNVILLDSHIYEKIEKLVSFKPRIIVFIETIKKKGIQ